MLYNFIFNADLVDKYAMEFKVSLAQNAEETVGPLRKVQTENAFWWQTL